MTPSQRREREHGGINADAFSRGVRQCGQIAAETSIFSR
jgi:hypothetical protein